MQTPRTRSIAVVLMLVAPLVLTGLVAGVQKLSCAEPSCDPATATCVCCPHLPRSVLTSRNTDPAVEVGCTIEPDLVASFDDPPPDDILHVPRCLS